jgi:hypothetical protein
MFYIVMLVLGIAIGYYGVETIITYIKSLLSK